MKLTPRVKLALIASLFALPIVASVVTYFFFPPSPTGNYGELLLPPAPAPTEVIAMRERWILMAWDRAPCEGACLEKITAMRLRDLVDEGLLEKRAYHEPGQRRREDYHLTDKGEDLLPALLALMRWGDRWVRADGGRVRLSHKDCRAPIDVEIRCGEGHSVTAADIQAARPS